MTYSTLLLVESPAKAKKIQSYVGKDIKVVATFGHIIDLPKKELGIDIENGYKMNYQIMSDKKKKVKELKELGKGKRIILAADADREGDAIAWHCGNLFNLDFSENNRITFNEISKSAIQRALENIHTLDIDSVNSQQTRRCIDRLIGYGISPLLWKHINTKQSGLSAGRVQSALLDILKKHEEHIENHDPDLVYDIKGTLYTNEKKDINCEFIIDDSVDDIDIIEMYKSFTKNHLFTVAKEKNQSKRNILFHH